MIFDTLIMKFLEVLSIVSSIILELFASLHLAGSK